ncbi:hypothetical protein [Mangrovibacterium diazotrophicum]|uniref:Uncharacterized protein n=1 Tax=Mangrovibacterium diazotrophicum TaxID=1261403 RepID=A0A419VY46_9BACT|nr:hypothetical protein [Mangrovibacterium diazotrophicum]RKD88161.1 hypothetical protein BC643_3304 [Mangrovibacterium diazotrophicum]
MEYPQPITTYILQGGILVSQFRVLSDADALPCLPPGREIRNNNLQVTVTNHPRPQTKQQKMEQKELPQLTDQELLEEAKNLKSAAITNDVLIGVLIGIVIYSILKSSFGFLTLIPLFLIYKLVNNSKYDKKELENLLAERNLK